MSKKKREQLGMPHSTASNKLKKNIMFALVKQAGFDICHRCKCFIKDEKDLSIEHIEPWLDNKDPKELFFDLNNIAFSHLSCNSSAARKTTKKEHGTINSYKRGCRCDSCKKKKTESIRAERERRKERTGKDR